MKYKLQDQKDIPAVNETFKQKIHVKTEKNRRLEMRNKFYCQNMTFQNDAKKFKGK